MTDSKQRRLESLATLIKHQSTGENERNAAIGRWEAIAGRKWADNVKSNPSGGQQKQQQQRKTNNTKSAWEDFEENIRRSGFGGFGGFSGFGGYDYTTHFDEKTEDDTGSYAGFGFGRDKYGREQDFGHSTCTQKQYDYVKSISDFFRWKCPDRDHMEFEEAQDFLDKHSELFKMFSPYGRNFSNLKKLFEAFGINWNQTKRTFLWKAFHERS